MRNFIKKLLKENIDYSLEEATYPESFNIEEFKKLTSFKDRIKYVSERLTKLGAGSSRIVYKIDDETVLKLAKNAKGVAQNENEIDYSQDSYLEAIIANVFEYDDNGLWVEMEFATPIKKSSFEQIVGVSFENYSQAMRYYYFANIKPSRYNTGTKPENYDELWENEFMYEMFDFLGNYQPPIGDLTRLSTYGIVKRNGVDTVVMIDYGLNDDVYNQFYKR
jgi:hypothetical protein